MSSVLLCNSSEESSSSTYIHEGQPGHLLSEKDSFYSKKKKKRERESMNSNCMRTDNSVYSFQTIGKG